MAYRLVGQEALDDHACATKTDGTLWCWKEDSEQGPATEPQPVTALGSEVSSVALGAGYTCATKIDGTLWCWGKNYRGQLGDGTTESKTAPIQVATLGAGVISVAAGSGGHTCAIKTDRTLWCWGDNRQGQLGDGTADSKTVPVQVTSLGKASSVAVGGAADNAGFSCAIKSDGTLWCWGSNGSGQLGDGTTLDKSLPVQVTSLGVNVTSVAASTNRACALKSDGTLWCWGDGYYGLTESSSHPVEVIP